MPKKKAPTEIGLKIVRVGGVTHGGFVWPLTVGAIVRAPDWQPTTQCGHGLHFWPRGEGKVETCAYHTEEGAIGLAIEYDPTKAIPLDGDEKSKVEECQVVFVGSVRDAAAYVAARNPGAKVIYGTSTSGYSGTSTSGDRGTSTSGYSGTSTSGDRGTSTSGYSGTSTSGYRGTSTSGDSGTSTSGDSGTSTSGDRGTSTSGYRGTSTSGDSGTSTSGYSGTSTSGYRGTSTSGDRGTSTSGYSGTSTSGDRGTSTSGDRGTSTSGDRGTSTSGYSGTSTSGEYGTISILYYDSKLGVYRRKVAECDPVGPVKPWRRYTLSADGEWIEGAEVPVDERPAAILARALASGAQP